MRRIATATVLVAIACFALAAWLAFRPDDGAAPRTSGEGYSDLQIERDEFGWFAGTITVSNESDFDRMVMVRVNLYDGEQNVGELLGDVMLKPESASSLELSSVDEYRDYTEARVNLFRG